MAMSVFEVGKTYYSRFPGMWDCVMSFRIKRRTAKTVTIEDEQGKTRTCRISSVSCWSSTETVYPLGSYSFCPVLRADRTDSNF